MHYIDAINSDVCLYIFICMCVYICIDFSCICVRIYIEMGSVNPRKAYDKYALVSEAALTQVLKIYLLMS